MTALERNPEKATAAHVLRRLTMAPQLDRVERHAGQSIDDIAATLFDDETIRRHTEADPPSEGRSGDDDEDRELNTDDVVAWWLEQMTAQDSGIVDRMAWFWHGHLTTNSDKVDSAELVSEQLITLRRQGLGNFRTLLNDVVTGGAMLRYLDASYSEASNPNENLARELMELFTMGRGNYSEDDVKAAARALAGWVVESTEDGEPPTTTWHHDRAFIAPLLFLGEQARWDTDMVVDRLCDDPATARFVASRLWDHLVRVPLGDDARDDLGDWWAGKDLEIRPLVERIVGERAFADSAGAGVRSPLEWWTGLAAATGRRTSDNWSLFNLGQYPYAPPNVGGWPGGTRWLSPGSMMNRARFAFDLDPAQIPGLPSETDAILDRCSLFSIDSSIRDAMNGVFHQPDIDPDSLLATRWRLALSSPEFQLS